jgi:CRP-like cAMP-binding protein
MGCELCKLSSEQVEDLDGASIAIGGKALKVTISFLSKIDLFQNLAPEDLTALARICKSENFEPGDIIVKQGETGDALYCISKGLAKAVVDNTQVASLTPGDYFGEDAILRGARRTATILAETQCTALKVTKIAFAEMELLDKMEFPERPAVAGGGNRPVDTKPPSPKTEEERKLMVKALKNNKNLTEVRIVDEKLANKIIEPAWKETIPAGKQLTVEGDFIADHFYMIQAGTFEVSTKQQKGQCIEKSVSVIASKASQISSKDAANQLGPGDSFGELALLYYTPRAATVTAKTECVVWVVDRPTFKKILAESAAEATGEYIQYFEGISAFKIMKDSDKKEVAGNLVDKNFTQGEKVIEEGEEGSTFYIMVSGTVSVSKDGKEKQIQEATPGNAKAFELKALEKPQKHEYTVKVTSPEAKFLTIDKQSFDMLVEGVEEYIRRTVAMEPPPAKTTEPEPKPSSTAAVSSAPAPAPVTVPPAPSGIGGYTAVDVKGTDIRFKDLKEMGVLGTGGFGLVKLVDHTASGNIYALKAISKGLVVESGLQKGVMEEKRIQAMCSECPFIIKLVATYSNDQTLYFLIEPALGGELFRTYKNQKLSGSEKHARFYSAGVLFAFEHLHSKKVIYRDLKPENVMLSNSGHVKLTDFGLAKVSPGKTFTTCGTPEYFAPEVIWATGYTNAADWWCYGVFIFELMAGKTPFQAREPMQIYANVLKGMAKASFPECMEGECKKLVLAMCSVQAADRLPMKKGGLENIKDHSWYITIDWDDIKTQKAKAPYQPVIKSKTDLANFARRKPPKPPKVVQYKDDGTGWDKGFASNT